MKGFSRLMLSSLIGGLFLVPFTLLEAVAQEPINDQVTSVSQLADVQPTE